ncbi:MAG: peptidoglycan DD-metalloendopeptidase family protein [Nitrospiraceae bacterium]|nr:peptidoglycan DD-metalloendopeptidase family protein [Nitrospiraceae bacterium]
MKSSRARNPKKKEYFTVMIVPGPNSRVRTISISKSAIKSALLSILGVVILSFYLVYEYHDVKGKVWELQSLREELSQQKAQVQNFALNLLDYKRQMFLLRDLDTKLRRAVSLGPRDKAQQVLGIGGPDELGLQNVTALGEKKQAEALKEMSEELTQLKGAASRQEASLQMLIEYFEDKRSLLASTPSIWPVRGWVTSRFGTRTSPFSGILKFHEGMDIAAQTGTPVVAAADGVVVKAGFSTGYGNMVEIHHGYRIRTLYAHNSRLNVKAGQRVHRGDVIAYAGDSGSSTGPHLHYEVKVNGLPVNPAKYLN